MRLIPPPPLPLIVGELVATLHLVLVILWLSFEPFVVDVAVAVVICLLPFLDDIAIFEVGTTDDNDDNDGSGRGFVVDWAALRPLAVVEDIASKRLHTYDNMID
jgi:hypothetical protein